MLLRVASLCAIILSMPHSTPSDQSLQNSTKIHPAHPWPALKKGDRIAVPLGLLPSIEDHLSPLLPKNLTLSHSGIETDSAGHQWSLYSVC